jgi:hypothetical protein
MSASTTTEGDKTVSLDDDRSTELEQLIEAKVSEAVDERLGELERRVDELAEEIAGEADRLARDATDDRQRIHALEERMGELEEAASEDPGAGMSEGRDPRGSGGENAPAPDHIAPTTPLERVAGLPEHLAESELTANVGRARFVARGVMEYSQSAPAGRVISSSDLRRVLVAGTDAKGHGQTVTRVLQALEELGGDGVTVVERRGERRVVFDEGTADRLARLAVNRDSGDGHAVVTRAEG